MKMKAEHIDIAREAGKLRKVLEKALQYPGDSPFMDFYISSVTECNPYNTTAELIQWIEVVRSEERMKVQVVPLNELKDWKFDDSSGDLKHKSGGFFSICGLSVAANSGPIQQWTQPIIYQPEIGLLGMITKKIDGILYFLIQAKAEPGNIGSVQVAPTVQSTRSNFLCLHNGASTRYIEYFFNDSRAKILIDQLQSEQGARFYQKRNRNVIVQVNPDENIPPHPDFRWATLGQLKKLMRIDNMVNMDARSVISTIPFVPERGGAKEKIDPLKVIGCIENSKLTTKPSRALHVDWMLSECCDATPYFTMDKLMQAISSEKFQCALETRIIPLKDVKKWEFNREDIHHSDNRYFRIIGVHVEASGREVASWDQPILQQCHEGIAGFALKKIEGVLHFLVQLKLECGNIDILGLAPTIQCITDSYKYRVSPVYVNEVLNEADGKIILDTMQSEEGGRFYREENRNLLFLADDNFPLEVPKRYLWMTLSQIKRLLKFNNFLNVELRSLIAMV